MNRYEIKPAVEDSNPEVETWLERMSDQEPDKVDNALEFCETAFDKDNFRQWARPYWRCLTVLGSAGNDRMVATALDLFLNDPSYRQLVKNFKYLRNFATSCPFSTVIARRLTENTFTFPYHRAYLFRLAAYSRDETEALKQLALEESANAESHWFCRMASLFCLDTFYLDKNDLAPIEEIIKTEANPQVLRAAFIALCQHSGDELRWVLDRVSYFNAPHQDYFRRYFFQLFSDQQTGTKLLLDIKGASVKAPTFIHNFHKLDLLKANVKQRALFDEVMSARIEDCNGENWPRFRERLDQINKLFVRSR